MQPDISLSALSTALLSPSDLLTLGRNWRSAYQELLLAKLGNLFEISKGATGELVGACQILSAESLRRWITLPEVAHALLHGKLGSQSQIASLYSPLLLALRLDNNGSSSLKSLLNYIDLDNMLFTEHGVVCEMTGGISIPPQEGFFDTLTYPRNPANSSERICKAMQRLRGISKPSHEFIVENTSLLCVREDLENTNSFSSSSYARYAGLTLLVNIEAPHIDEFRIIDSLYHEAIHAVIYFYEEIFGEIANVNKTTEVKLISPWSGNRLGIPQYVQACFVWWGLLNLWKKLNISIADLGDSSRWLEARAMRGFEKNPSKILQGNTLAMQNLSPEAIGAISLIQSKFELSFRN